MWTWIVILMSAVIATVIAKKFITSRVIVVALVGATVTAGIQVWSYLELGYKDKFWILTAIITFLVAAITSGLTLLAIWLPWLKAK
jgi:hypothetical protein